MQTALTAAQLYYVQNRTMEAIASELRVSRSSVSRLLTYARETGLVDIRVRSPQNAIDHVARQIAHLYGVTAHIVPMPERVSDMERLERVSVSAARLLGQVLDSSMTLGVAWGRTVGEVSRHLLPAELQDMSVVQLNGAGNSQSTGVTYITEMLHRFGSAFNAATYYLPVPAFFDDPETKQALWRERSIRHVLDMQKRMDVALFSLGAPQAEIPSQVHFGGYLEASDLKTLWRERVVGDVATVFYRDDGSYRDITLNARSSGIDLELLKAAPRRICVIAGKAKVASLRGALAAGLITDLVLDQGAAQALVADAAV